MKKKALIFLGVLCSCVCGVCGVFAEPFLVRPAPAAPAGFERFERIEKRPTSLSLKKTGDKVLGIKISIQAPDLDEDEDGFCRMYSMNTEITVPPEGASFYSIYYFRIKGPDGEWGEWKKTFTGGTWYWSQEDARRSYIRFTNTLLDELDGNIPPSRAQFKEEMYNTNDVLVDEFETASNGRKYWAVSLVESKNNDVLPSSPDAEQ